MMAILIWFMETGKAHTECGLGMVNFWDTTTEEIQKPSRIRTVIAADFDNDGNEELFFNNIGEANRFFEKTEDGSDLPTLEMLLKRMVWELVAVLDFDGDGKFELLIAHGESDPQPLSLYRWPSNENNYIRILPKQIWSTAWVLLLRFRHRQNAHP